MIHKFKEINWNPDRAKRKKFALTLMAGFPCMAVGLSLITRLVSGAWHFQAPIMIGAIGLAVAAISWLVPAIALPVYRVWYFLVCIIDTVVTAVALTLLYYLIMCPAGFLYQILSRSGFLKKPNSAASSYWRDVEPVEDVRRYYRQF